MLIYLWNINLKIVIDTLPATALRVSWALETTLLAESSCSLRRPASRLASTRSWATDRDPGGWCPPDILTLSSMSFWELQSVPKQCDRNLSLHRPLNFNSPDKISFRVLFIEHERYIIQITSLCIKIKILPNVVFYILWPFTLYRNWTVFHKDVLQSYYW